VSDIIELANATDRYRFRFGRSLSMRLRVDGQLRHENWRDRWTEALASFFWPRGSFMVTHIDRKAGTITIGDAP
jgi:hypothetical protein